MNDARFQQTAHGFTKLTAIRSEAGLWRRCISGETPHAIVARVIGIDTFSIVTSGELDGLEGLPVGATYGVGTNGDLTVGKSPVVARMVRDTAILISFSTAVSVENGTDLSGVNGAILTIQGTLTALTASVATKASSSTTVTGQFSVTGGGDLTANRQLRLINDVLTPGISKYYGTNNVGIRGWIANAYVRMANVRDFNAVGDGVADDSAAIAATIASAIARGLAGILFPKGTYLTSTITIATAGFYVGGEGTLKLKTGTVRSVLIVVTASNVTIGDNLTLDGDLQGPGGFGDGLIQAQDVTGLTVRDCRLINGKGGGAYVQRCPDVQFLNCRVASAQLQPGIFVHGGSNNAVVSFCNVVSCRTDGIKITGYDGITLGTKSLRCRVADCLVDYSTVVTFLTANVLGIELWQGADSSIISRCIVRGQTTLTQRVWGVSIDASYNCVVSGNTITKGILYGLEGADARYMVYEGNTVEDADLGFSVSSTNAGQVVIRGNTFRTTISFGLQVVTSTCQVLVAQNTFSDCLNRPIFLNSAGANSAIIDNLIVSESLGAVIKEGIYPQSSPDCIIANNVLRWQPGTAGAWIIAVDAPRTTVLGNRLSAGSAGVNTNAIIAYAAATDSVFTANASSNYNYHTVDTVSTLRSQVHGNRSTTANAINPAAGDSTIGNVAIGGVLHPLQNGKLTYNDSTGTLSVTGGAGNDLTLVSDATSARLTSTGSLHLVPTTAVVVGTDPGGSELLRVGGSIKTNSSISSISPTAGVGYGAGSGGTVTQITSRSTGVTINKINGEITLVSAVGSSTAAAFTVTNSTMAATDHVVVNQKSGADLYTVFITKKAAGSFQITFYNTGATTVEQPVFSFAIIKGANS